MIRVSSGPIKGVIYKLEITPFIKIYSSSIKFVVSYDSK